MTPKNLCPQCGAHINMETLECPFCKAIYKNIDVPEAKKMDIKKKTRLLISPPENITDAMLVKKIISATPNFRHGSSKMFFALSFVLLILSLGIWTVINFIPNFVVYLVSGVCFLLFVLFIALGYSASKTKIESFIVKLIVKKDYEGARDLAKKNETLNSCKIAFMLIMYYRLSEYQKVKDLIFTFDLNKLTHNQYALYEEVSGNFLSKL